MNNTLHKPHLLRPKTRTVLMLAMLLGGFGIARVSNAQSTYLINALHANGDPAGTVTPTTTSTVLDNALKAEAGNSSAAPVLASDISYILGAIGAPHVAADYVGFISALGNSTITAANFEADAAAIAGDFAGDATLAADGVTIVQDLATAANKVGGTSSIPTIAATVVGDLSPTNVTADISSITQKATDELAANPNPDTAAEPTLATDLASVSGLTLTEQALIAKEVISDGAVPAATNLSSLMNVETVALGQNNSPTGKVNVATALVTDITNLTDDEAIATQAATGQSGTEAGKIGAAVSSVHGVSASGIPTIALDVATAASGGLSSVNSLYQVAAQFGAGLGTVTGKIPVTEATSISNALVTAALNNIAAVTSGNPNAEDSVAADVVGAFTEGIASTSGGTLSSANETEIKSIVEASIAIDPNAGPDVLGYVLQSLSGYTSTPGFATFAMNLESTADEADTSAAALAALDLIYPGLASESSPDQKEFVEAVVGSAYTSQQSGGTIASNTDQFYTNAGLVTPTETPITDL